MMDKDFILVRDFFQKQQGTQEGFTLGTLSLGSTAIGMTCEDEDRHLENNPTAKVYGKTCIPRGRYKLVLSFSHRFGKVLPELLDVPGYAGVRIHGGNTAADSEGCLLVGRMRIPTGVAQCAPVVARIIDLIQQAEDEGATCWIKII